MSIILLSVTRKIADIAEIEVSQPFYAPAWPGGDASPKENRALASASLKARLNALLPRGAKLSIILRNMYLLYGLASGGGPYALARRCERKIDVESLLKEQSA